MVADRPASAWAPALLALHRSVSLVERGLVALAAVAVFAMMLVLVVDVGGRYLFNRPLAWSYDVISIYMLPLVVYLAIADAYRRNQHISVDLIYNSLGRTGKRLVRLLAAVIVVAVMSPIAWLAAGQAITRYENKVVISGSILWPTWIPALFLAAGAGLLIVRALVDGLALAAALAGDTETVAGESEDRQRDVAHGGDAT